MKYLNLAIVIILSGCASQPKVEWITSSNIDEFTDQKTCSVTVGSYYTSSNVYTISGHYYPFIEVVNDQLRLGVKSGGTYPIPVGDVQLRIDGNIAWTITTSETPLDSVPEGTLDTMKQYAENLPEEQKKLVENTYNVALENTAKMMSPFTASTGDKANKILKEMLNGKVLKYRKIGFNQAASTTGEFKLDMSLKNALISCGIKL